MTFSLLKINNVSKTYSDKKEALHIVHPFLNKGFIIICDQKSDDLEWRLLCWLPECAENGLGYLHSDSNHEETEPHWSSSNFYVFYNHPTMSFKFELRDN